MQIIGIGYKKKKYWSITRHNPTILFKTINYIIGPLPSQPVKYTPDNCNTFLNYVYNKIMEIRQQFDTDFRDHDVDSCPPSTFTHFNEISLSTLEHIFVLSKSSSCPSDCLPAWFLKAVLHTVSPDILDIVNCSLCSGIFPHVLNMPLFIHY